MRSYYSKMTSVASYVDNMVEELLRLLKEKFGHQKYKNQIQRKAVEAVALGEQDVFVSMPTGAGKSLCYQLPAMCTKRNGVTVVITPLIALMMNQLQQMRLIGIPSETINSTMPKTERERVQNDLCSSKPVTKLLYITPEQAATHNFRAILDKMYSNGNLARFAVDEAHCASQWGHDFRPDYLRLCEIRLKYPSVPWLALTATAAPRVVDDILFLLKLKEPVVQFRTSTFRPNLYYDVVFKECIEDSYEDLKQFAVLSLGQTWEDVSPKDRGCGIIYCRTRDACEEVAMKLTKLGLLTKAYHAGMKPKDRTSIQNEWMTGQTPIIAATVSFGMGVDKASVRFVVHWVVSQSLPAYYQESGRAGRDGKLSRCRIYYSRKDRETITFLLKKDMKQAKTSSEQKGRDAIEAFNQVIQYCEEAVCRHMSLAKAFGDYMVKCKEHCDVCHKPRKVEKRLAHFRSTLLTTKVGRYESKSYNALPSNNDSELYGGGRRGIKRESEEYAGGSDEEVDYDKKAAKELKMFIQDEFERRRKQIEKKPDMEDSHLVLNPNSKLIPEVTLDIRTMYLLKLKDEISEHYQAVNSARALNDRDLLDCAASHELNVFSTKGNIYMYRREFVELFKSLRSDTERHELHPLIAQYSPTQCAAKQECKKQKKPKERLYTLLDLIPKMEAKNVCVNDEKNDRKTNNGTLNGNNTSLNETTDYISYSDAQEKGPEIFISHGSTQEKEPDIFDGSVAFSKGNDRLWESNMEELSHSSNSSDDSDQKESKIEESWKNVNPQVMKAVPLSRPVIKYFFENPHLQETSENEQQENSDSHGSADEICERKHLQSLDMEEPHESEKQEELCSTEINSEIKFVERDPRKRKREAAEPSRKRKQDKPEHNHQRSSHDKNSNSANLKVAADYVRKFLDPKYKKQEITKEMFKIACRKIAHKLVDSSVVNEEAAEMAVKKLFSEHPVIKSESDLIDV